MNNTLPPSASQADAAGRGDSSRSLISSVEQQRQARIQTIQTQVDIKIGQTVQAIIERVAAQPVSNAMPAPENPVNTPSPGQAQLLALLKSNADLLGQKPIADQKAQTSSTPVNQVDLRIQHKLITVLTPLILKIGQPINVTLTPAGDLKLVPPTTASPKIQEILNQALRESLPQQRPVSEFIQQIRQLVQNPVLNQALLSPELRQTLTQVITQVVNNPPANSTALRGAIYNSGLQLEGKLGQASQLPTTKGSALSADTSRQSATQILQQDLKGQLLSLKQHIEQTGAVANTADKSNVQTGGANTITPAASLSVSTSVSASTSAHISTAAASNPTANNTAGGNTGGRPLLYNPEGRLLDNQRRPAEQTNTGGKEFTAAPSLSAGTGSEAEKGPPPLLSQATNAASLPEFTNAILQFFAAGAKNAGEFNVKQLRTQLVVLLHRQLLQTLAGITGKQAESLTRQHGRSESGSGMLHWNLELPLRMGEHIVPLYLVIEEQHEQDANAKDKANEKARRWEVRMSFELPEQGNLHAHIRLLQNTVSASLWAEQEGLLVKAKEQLASLRNHLEKSGITVEKIECQQGTPPLQANALGYALVDIKT